MNIYVAPILKNNIRPYLEGVQALDDRPRVADDLILVQGRHLADLLYLLP